MGKRVLWCITGSGSFIHEVVELIAELKRMGVEVRVCLSRAGEEVAKIYGVLDDLQALGIAVIRERSRSGAEVAGDVAMGKYSAVVLAPATSNTVSKVVIGVADTLPTIAASQALKRGIPLLVLPSDYAESVPTTYPCVVERGRCVGCGTCIEICPCEAMSLANGRAVILYERCRGCGLCAVVCRRNCISCWEKGFYTCSQRDVENAKKLSDLGALILTTVDELRNHLRVLLRNGAQLSPASSS